MYPTLEAIRNALADTYPEPELTAWATWLHEQYHKELPHLRGIVFNTMLRKLRDSQRRN
jgi:hypothetical protein